MDTRGLVGRLTEQQIETLIENSGGYWREDHFVIVGAELSEMLQAAAAAALTQAALAAVEKLHADAIEQWKDAEEKLAAARPSAEAVRIATESISTAVNGFEESKSLLRMNGWPKLAELCDENMILSRELLRIDEVVKP